MHWVWTKRDAWMPAYGKMAADGAARELSVPVSAGQDRSAPVRAGQRRRGGVRVVSDLPLPSANRLPRARWLDARLAIGLLLVLVAVVIGAKVFADADERVQVWSVTRDLGADTPLTRDDLEVAAVRLDGVAGRYVSAGQTMEGRVLTRQMGRGELLPLSALRTVATLDQRRVVIEVDRFGVAGLAKGRVVDLYVVRDLASDEPPAEPELVLAGVTVGEDVASGGSGFGAGGSKAGVSLLVDAADVPDLIDAVAHGSVYVVQVSGRS